MRQVAASGKITKVSALQITSGESYEPRAV